MEDTNESLEFPNQEMTLKQAREIDSDLEVGDVIEEPVESVKFGRIAVQQAKQVIVQKSGKPSEQKSFANMKTSGRTGYRGG